MTSLNTSDLGKPSLGLAIIEKPEAVEAALWRRFHINGEAIYRIRVFEYYQADVQKIARTQFYRRPKYGLEWPDFEQLAYEGLLKAIDGFDPKIGTPFMGYARFRILGMITDGLSRSCESGAQYSARRRRETERMKSLKSSMVTSNVDPLAQLVDLVSSLAVGLILEDTALCADENTPDFQPTPYDSLAWKELQVNIRRAVQKLSDSESFIIEQHYLKGVAFTQIADLLNLSRGRVSQIHKNALQALHNQVGAAKEDWI